MTLKFIKFTALILVFLSCHQPNPTNKANNQQISVDSLLEENSEIESFIMPYKQQLEKSVSEILCFSLNTHTKKQGLLNTAIGNMMADAVFELSTPILKKQYNLDLDMVLLNHGGIRSDLPSGPIRIETVFNIMPFENKVVVAKMQGSAVMDMVDYLIKDKRAHPISGIELQITKDGKLEKLRIQNKLLNPKKNYKVATSDYLFNGGDRMDFFKKSDTLFRLDYKIRNLLIDYFSKKDTLNPKRDERFIYVN
jgi:2',3'-cyclic-nucleotide 2'-phosphodiesterase (5'-nucleotidase family)